MQVRQSSEGKDEFTACQVPRTTPSPRQHRARDWRALALTQLRYTPRETNFRTKLHRTTIGTGLARTGQARTREKFLEYKPLSRHTALAQSTRARTGADWYTHTGTPPEPPKRLLLRAREENSAIDTGFLLNELTGTGRGTDASTDGAQTPGGYRHTARRVVTQGQSGGGGALRRRGEPELGRDLIRGRELCRSCS